MTETCGFSLLPQGVAFQGLLNAPDESPGGTACMVESDDALPFCSSREKVHLLLSVHFALSQSDFSKLCPVLWEIQLS